MDQELFLIVTDPPQPDKVDYAAVADCFNLPIYETKVRLGFPAPEILFSDPDHEEHDALLNSLTHAGLRVFSIPGSMLDLLPPLTPVTGFEFHNDRIDWKAGDAVNSLPNKSDVFMFTCRPAVEGIPPDRLTAAKKKDRLKAGLKQAMGTQYQGRFESYAGAVARVKEMRKKAMASYKGHLAASAQKSAKFEAMLNNRPDFRDYWFIQDGQIGRLSFSARWMTDYSGLGAQRTPAQIENFNNVLKLAESRYSVTISDKRMVGVHFRTAPVGDRTWKDVVSNCIPGGASPYDVVSRLSFIGKNREAIAALFGPSGDSGANGGESSDTARRMRKSFE